MGALPKRRWSTQRQGKRRSGHQAPLPTLVVCRHCGELKRPHYLCPSCHKS